MAEILQGFDFYPPVSDHFGQLCQAKNFFFTPTFDNFPQCQILLEIFQSKKFRKKEGKKSEVTICFLVGHSGNFPNKMAKYGNFETELERVNKQLNVYYAT